MTKNTPQHPALPQLLRMVADVEDLSEDELDAELADKGIDFAKASAALDAVLKSGIARIRRSQLDLAEEVKASLPNLLPTVQQLKLPFSELVNRIIGMEAAFAHRDLEKMTREVLEQHLASLLALEEARKK